MGKSGGRQGRRDFEETFRTFSDLLGWFTETQMRTPNKQLIQGNLETLRKVWFAPVTLKELKFNNKKWVRSAWERTGIARRDERGQHPALRTG